jgi:signal peptidase I
MLDQNVPDNATPAPEPAAPPARAPLPPHLRSLMAWARDLTVSVMIAVVLIVFIYQPVKVEGTSMVPSLQDQERIFINKFTYRFGLGDIQRGDTVVFWYPLDPSKSYIKRVIGVPGDLVRIESGQVYVNGQALVEDYVVDHDRVSWPIPPAPLTDRQVPPGVYFVLGDNRGSSSDSRSWGYVPRDAIYGKAVFAYWPLGAMGIVR